MEDIKDILDKITHSEYNRLRSHFLGVQFDSNNNQINAMISQFKRIEKLLKDKN